MRVTDGRTDVQTNGQNYRASIAASRGKNEMTGRTDFSLPYVMKSE